MRAVERLFRTSSQRLAHSMQHVSREGTEKILRKRSQRLILSDTVAARRDEQRQHIAHHRRGLQSASEGFKHLSTRLHRLVRYKSVHDSQGVLVEQAMSKRERRLETSSHIILERCALYQDVLKTLGALKVPIDFAVVTLLGLQTDNDAFETLAESLMKWLGNAAKHLQQLGPGVITVNWAWRAFDALYNFLTTEAEWGRIPDEWSRYRTALEDFAQLVTPVSTSSDVPQMFIFGESDMHGVKSEPSGSTLGSSTSSNTTTTPSTVEGVSGVAVGKSDVTIVSSPPKAPQIATARTSLPQMATTVTPVQAPTATPPPPPPEVPVQVQILNGTGRFDVASRSSIADIANVLNDEEYMNIVKDKATELQNSVDNRVTIQASHTEFLMRSCEYVLTHKDAPWFDTVQVGEHIKHWAQKVYILRVRLRNLIQGRCEELTKLESTIWKVYCVFNGGGGVERKAKPLRVRGG